MLNERDNVILRIVYKEKTRRNRRADVLPTISKSLVERGKLFIERAAMTLIYDAFGL